MVFGRILGWLLVAAAVLLASADAVMALGLGDDTAGIATGEMVTLLSGYEVPHAAGARRPIMQALGLLVLDLPAWTVLGGIGVLLCWACRRRPKRFRFRGA